MTMIVYNKWQTDENRQVVRGVNDAADAVPEVINEVTE